MVIPQYADAHAPVGRYLTELGNVNVIQIFHSHGPLVRPIGGMLPYRKFHAGIPELPDDIFPEAASLFAPETLADLQLVKIIRTHILRQSIQQEIHVLFPRKSRRTFYRLAAHSRRIAVYAREIHSVDPADHLPPCIRVNRTIYLQRGHALRNERTGNPLARDRNTGLPEQVIQPVVIPAEFTVGCPNVISLPVVERIGIVDVIVNPVGPLEIPEPLIILVAVYRPPTVIALLSAYPDKAAYPLAFLPAPQPRGEKHLEVIIPQFFAEKVKILSGKTS